MTLEERIKELAEKHNALCNMLKEETLISLNPMLKHLNFCKVSFPKLEVEKKWAYGKEPKDYVCKTTENVENYRKIFIDQCRKMRELELQIEEKNKQIVELERRADGRETLLKYGLKEKIKWLNKSFEANKQLESLKLKWVEEAPRMAGKYWVKSKFGRAWIVRIGRDYSSTIFVQDHDGECCELQNYINHFHIAKWAGPIPEPAEEDV